MDAEYWKHKTLAEMSSEEWENLCDGCAQCCQLRVDVDESKKPLTLPVVCKLLDQNTCRCTNYLERQSLVPNCVRLTPENAATLPWIPETCSYKLIAQRKSLFDWHPLIAGDRRTMDRLQISVKGRVLSESDIHPDDLNEQVIKWVKAVD